MPSEKILEQKKQTVTALSEKLKNSVSGVIVDYMGIDVASDTKLRGELRREGVTYSVEKNTLIRLALRQAGLPDMDEYLKGCTAIAISDSDVVAPAKVLAKYTTSKGKDKIVIKGGFIEGKAASESEIMALSKLPPKEVLIAKALGGLNAPISGFVTVLNANLTGLVRVLNAAAEKQTA
jgi:large subunit ribosomal protein L10